jgi:hypothetical protein
VLHIGINDHVLLSLKHPMRFYIVLTTAHIALIITFLLFMFSHWLVTLGHVEQPYYLN